MVKVFVTGTRGIPGVMGGVETHCENLYPRLAEMGYDITVARRDSYVMGDRRTEWRGVRLVDIATPRKKAFEAIIHTWRAVWHARRSGADIVHIHAVGPALVVPLARLLGLKVVMTNHGPDYDRDKWGRMAKAVLKLGESLGSRYANDVIVISETIRDNIGRRYGRTKNVHLIYNGVPEPEFCDEPEWFAELGIEPGRYVLGMSRFVPEKNLHHLIEAFGKSTLAERGYRLVLAGDADFEDDYSRSLKELARANNVVLTGFIRGRRLQAILTHAACFVLPSSHEGLPIALLEAMSYRLPVIVSDIPANTEVGLPAACYFHVGDVKALANRLSDLPDAGERARMTYDLSKYDWSTIAGQVAAVYDGLSADRSKHTETP